MKKLSAACCAVMLLLASATSCKKEKSSTSLYPIPDNLKLMSSGYANGAGTKVEIYAADDFFVGYNKVYIALYDSASGTRITQAQVSFMPQMDMGMTHTTPFENPVADASENGLFSGAVVFVMPSSSGSNWSLTTHVNNTQTGNEGDFISAVNVIQPTPSKEYSLVAQDDSSMLFVSMVEPKSPQIGSNDFELTIHKKMDKMHFAPDSSYTVEITPEMPSMGHGSPNNIDPISTGNGHYAGKVNFIMGGGWRVHIILMHSGVISDSTHYFDVNI